MGQVREGKGLDLSARYLIAVDPGLRECGVAVYELATGRLLGAWLVRSPEASLQHNPAWSAMALAVLASLEARHPGLFAAPGLCWFIGETPRLHPDAKTAVEERADPNVLFQTCGSSAAVGTALAVRGAAPVEQQRGVRADVWTDGRPKVARQRAVRWLRPSQEKVTWEELPAAERAVVDEAAKSNLHHVLDAVDLGAWFHARWKQGHLLGTGPVLPEAKVKQQQRQRAALGNLKLKPAVHRPAAPAGPVPFGKRQGVAPPQASEGRVPYGQQLRARGVVLPAAPVPGGRRGRR